MGFSIEVNEEYLILPRDFEIEWEENNYAFEDDSVFGDYSIPITVPVKGNEKAIGFAHEIATADKVIVIDGARCYDNENLLYTGSLAIVDVNRLHAKISFLIHDIAYFFGEKKLNDLDLPNVDLGANDDAVLAEAAESINDDSKLYCFPPIKADGFYGDDENMPSVVSLNHWNGSGYVTSETFNRPMVPAFRLLHFLEFLLNSYGYAMTGDIKQYPQFYYLVITHLAGLDRTKNPNDVSYSLEGYTLANLTMTWRKSLGHFAATVFQQNMPTVRIEEERKFALDFDFGLPEYSTYHSISGYVHEYHIDVAVWISSDELGFLNRELIAGNFNYNNGRGTSFTGDSLKGTHRITYTPTAGQVGKYIFLEIIGLVKVYTKDDGGVYDPFPTYTLHSTHPWNFPNADPTFSLRYFGENGSELLENKLDWSFLLPDMKVKKFFSDLKKDFNLRFNFHPFRKEVEVTLAKDLLKAPVKKITHAVRKDFKYKLNSKIEGYTFKQAISKDVDEEDEEALKYREFLGSFPGVDNFPDPQIASYVIDSISDEVYISVPDMGSFGVAWGSMWVLSHQAIRTVSASVGSGEREITAAFNPILSRKVEDGYELFYSGAGKSKYTKTAPDEKGFMIVNFFGKEASWNAPYASRTNYYKDGTQMTGAMVLNYDPEDVNSIYSFCWKQWVDFMLKRYEMELVFLHHELDGLDLGFRYEIGGRLFLIAQVRSMRGVNGVSHREATVYQIN